MNRNYGHIDRDTGKVVYAADIVTVDGSTYMNPSAATYLRAGEKRIVDERPGEPAPEGRHWERGGWTETETELVREWRLVDNPPPCLEDFDEAMEAHLREEREARGYTTREPDAYLGSSVPRWAQDARDWVAHRDAVMVYALGVMNAVEAGTREPPTLAEFRAGLPRIGWSHEEET